jgi:Ca-activated chloride channel family protein
MLLMLSWFVACGTPLSVDSVVVGALPPLEPVPPSRVSALFDTPPPVALPASPLVQRQCFGGVRDDAMAFRGGGIGGGGIGQMGGLGSGSSPGYGLGAKVTPAPKGKADAASGVAEASPPPAAPAVASEEKSAASKAAPADLSAAEDQAAASAEPPLRPSLGDNHGPKLDWGAKVYLSNDDSMSLASAQHLLHAVKHGESFSVSEIRPHELLNYFSFDTRSPEPGHLFSVVGAAEKIDEDSMGLAFAVHGATPPRRPLDLTLVIDRSGSMWDEGRMEYVKRGLMAMTGHLVAGDRVDVVLFDDSVCSPLENFIVGRNEISLLTSVIQQMQPRGGTNIGIGLNEGYRIAAAADRAADLGRNRRVMLLTDALANQGQIAPSALAAVSGGFETHGVRLTGVGVGVGFNDAILDAVTERGHGAYVYLGSEAVVDRLFGTGFDSLVQTIANDVQFSIQLPPSLAMERFYGEEASTDAADIQPINYYSGTTQLFLQDLTVDPSKLAPGDPIVFTMSYRDALTEEAGTETYLTTVGELLSADRHNIDKGRALMAWTDLLTARAMGSDACGAPLSTYATRAAKLTDDAEIAYVNGLVGQWCRLDLPAPPVSGERAAYKVKVDSDIPIAEVELACGGASWREALSGSDTVARFHPAASGACTLTLLGPLPMTAQVAVPRDGGDVKCTVRGGRVSCG